MNKLENINNKIDELKKEIIKLETEKNNIKGYESIIIINIKTSLKELQNIKDEIRKIVELNGNFDNIGIKKLAYEVQKQNEGYYIEFFFVGTNEDVIKLEKYYRENDNIIKFLNMINPEY